MNLLLRSAACSLLLLLAGALQAAIVINGITTRQYPGYANSVTFTVPDEAGFTIHSEVDGVAIPPNTPFTESRVGYHELFVTKTPVAGGTPETRLVQFIVRARVTADTGLVNWVPLQAVNAPADALATALVSFQAPARVPAGMPFPLAVRLTEANGKVARLNATVRASSPSGRAAAWQIFRGAGAGVWNAPTTPGPLVLTLHVGDRTFTRSVEILPSPTFQSVTGVVLGTQTFGPNGVMHITGDVSVPAGSTMRIEAGTVVRVNPGATIDVQGTLVIAGTAESPVLVTRLNPALPWGGFWIRGASASGSIAHALLTGAGANQSWMSGKGYSAHKPEQPVVACDGCAVTLTDTWIVDNPHGQAGHGHNASVTYTRCVLQRTKTGGQYNNGRARLLDSHIVEIPIANSTFTDDDNDGFYITGASNAGPHELTNSVIGWCKDDGADAGSGSAGIVNTSGCWFDSMFHEGMAWSESRTANVTDTVAINNGQGIEAGFGSPMVTANNLLLVGNHIGARFGDNYDWTYTGTLNVQNSFLLHNARDVWGYEWNSWTYRVERMNITGNFLTAPLALHPTNSVFNPATQASQVAAFLTAPATARGFGIVNRAMQDARANYGGNVIVHLDRPATTSFALPWRIIAKRDFFSDAEETVAGGLLEFSPGMNSRTFTLPALSGAVAASAWIAVIFDDMQDAVATGARALHFVDLPQPPPNPGSELIPFGAIWRYLDNGSNQGTTWRTVGFDDSTWASGPAELGYGDNDEATRVEDNPTPGYNAGDTNRYATTYFRRTFNVADVNAVVSLDLNVRYDDGVVVYINGQRVAFTASLSAPDPAFNFYLGGTAPPDNSILTATIPASVLNQGVNTIAAEIHQQAANSSDISFDLRLTGNPAPIAAQILSRTGSIGGRLFVLWSTPEAVPQTSTDLIFWQDRPDLVSPYAVTPMARERGFFRLSLPTP